MGSRSVHDKVGSLGIQQKVRYLSRFLLVGPCQVPQSGEDSCALLAFAYRDRLAWVA
jgi:hypothetical protein